MVSIIVCTLDRVQEVARLLASLERQTYRDFEVVLVDQNGDDRLRPILKDRANLCIRHLTSRRGLSRARNVALPLVKGDILCFPDDDCWYPDNLLASVVAWFSRHQEFVALFACLRDANGNPVGPRWPNAACLCTKENIWSIAISPSGFLRKSAADRIGSFNENIGVGSDSMYQSGEETDYFLRSLEQGYQMWFEPSFTVHHPSFHSPERLRRTTYSFALGNGYVMRIHSYPFSYLAYQVSRSLGGVVASLLKADFESTRIYLLRAAGQLRGYFWGLRDLAGVHSRAQ